MAQSHTRTGICPGCQHTITVPAELNIFSCLYCGRRLTPSELGMSADALSPVQWQSLRDMLAQELPKAVCHEPDTLKYMTKSAYPSRMEAYLQQYQPLFAHIPLLFPTPDPEKTASLAREVVAHIDRICGERTRGIKTKSALLEEAKFTLCLLCIPAMRTVNHPACEALSQAIAHAWSERYPKNSFRLATREDILAGFQPRKLCYITTAVCNQAGKPDDCRELNAFRCFRDEYLAHQPGGMDLIDRYYDCAPGITQTIDLCCDPETVYPALWRNWLLPCYEALCAGDNARCQRLYTQMVLQLPEKLLSGHKIS